VTKESLLGEGIFGKGRRRSDGGDMRDMREDSLKLSGKYGFRVF